MMSKKETFGLFIKERRLLRQISLRKFAEQLDISPVYLCNMEKNRNPAPNDDILTRMAGLLLLTETETELLYDLAAKSKSTPTVSKDLPEYIRDRDIVRIALRTAKDVDATDEEWQEFISNLEARRRKVQEEIE